MSDIRFACGYCSQHLECDDAWCGNVIACPSCAKQIQVPHYVVFAGPKKARSPAAVPSASAPASPKSASNPEAYARAYGLYTESDWERLAPDAKPRPPKRYSLVAVALVVLVAFSLISGGSMLAIIALIGGSAYGAGYLLDGSDDFGAVTLRTLLALVLFGAIALGVLFVGCSGACGDL